jgi:hypothetical protein
VGSVSDEEEPTLAEPRGESALQPIARGPRKVGDPRVEAGVVQECLKVAGWDGRAGLTEWQLVTTGRPGRQQPPSRVLSEREDEQHATSTDDDMSNSIL